MKHLSTTHNKQLSKLELSSNTCQQILTNQTRNIRFDILLEENENLTQMLRTKLFLDNYGGVRAELKDYRNNNRHFFRIPSDSGVTEAKLFALHKAWGILDQEKSAPK